MDVCPSCRNASIPTWRAFMPPFQAFNPKCSVCGAELHRTQRTADVVIFVPGTLINLLAFRLNATPASFVILSIGVGYLCGILLWLRTIKYEVVRPGVTFATPSKKSS